jgi:hypothetical protein
MQFKYINKIFIFVIIVLFASCKEILLSENPPYTITKPVFEITEQEDYFMYAGITFNFLNHSNIAIDEITVSFMLFDAETQESPFVGSNMFEITKVGVILPNENKKIFISLDKHVNVVPTEPYLIDYFYIYRIQYEDGSIWLDEYGVYN